MTFRSLRVTVFGMLTALMVFAGTGVARAQEGPVDHLRHRTHQIIRATDRVIRHHRPVVVRVYAPRPRGHYYRVRVYDRHHHHYYYRTYYRRY